MGFFDIFKKKKGPDLSKEDLSELSQIISKSFEKAKETDENISKKLDHLYIKHESLQGKHDKNLSLILSWFEHFQNVHAEHEKELSLLTNEVAEIQEKLKKIEKIDETFIRSVVEEYVTISSEDKSELEEELIGELMSVRDTAEVQSIDKNIQRTLTKSELDILNVLYNSNIPLSYIDLGRKVRKSPNTVKVYLNALKKKGIELEEHNAPRGIKLYSMSNKEKINKFYNLG